MIINTKTISILNTLSSEINKCYGYVTIVGDNLGEPAINSGPCAPFANAFYHSWNQKFAEKAHIVFIMLKNSDECWHVLIRLPDKSLFDGGIGVHYESSWDKNKFFIEDMLIYDAELLEKRSGGLKRTYPRYCPDFSLEVVSNIIDEYLDLIKNSDK